jgi:hypothetical protein
MLPMVHDSNRSLPRRIRQVRRELYGSDGVPALVEALGIPEQTWSNYESGVALPAPVLLVLIEQTGVNPHWLLTGEGERYTAKRFGDRFRRAEGP